MKTIQRRVVVALAAALSTWAAATATPALAQDWPTKPVRLIVNFPPGGAADVIGRSVAQSMSEALGQQIVVENRPGANGNLGADAVAKSPADGYTLLLSSGGAMTVNPFLYTSMPFDPQRDLVPVASAARVLVFLMAHPSVPANNFAEFVAHVKANPGRLSYGSAGNGSSPHLAAEMMKKSLGLFAVHVPYRGAAPALTDLLGNQVQFMFDPGPGLRHAREGRLKPLAVGSSQRSSVLPDLPTLAESGVAGFDADTVFGFYAPGGTPPALVERLHAEINKALQTQRVQDAMRTLGAEPMVGTRQAFVARQDADRARFGAFIREAGIKAD